MDEKRQLNVLFMKYYNRKLYFITDKSDVIVYSLLKNKITNSRKISNHFEIVSCCCLWEIEETESAILIVGTHTGYICFWSIDYERLVHMQKLPFPGSIVDILLGSSQLLHEWKNSTIPNIEEDYFKNKQMLSSQNAFALIIACKNGCFPITLWSMHSDFLECLAVYSIKDHLVPNLVQIDYPALESIGRLHSKYYIKKLILLGDVLYFIDSEHDLRKFDFTEHPRKYLFNFRKTIIVASVHLTDRDESSNDFFNIMSDFNEKVDHIKKQILVIGCQLQFSTTIVLSRVNYACFMKLKLNQNEDYKADVIVFIDLLRKLCFGYESRS